MKKTGFVLDASIALAWCFKDEETPETKKLLLRLETETAFVPSLWQLEVGNALVMAVKRKRISFAEINQFISSLEQLNINVDHESKDRSFHEIISYAHSYHLTTYDAAYLELAMRLGLPLASKDALLCAVAKSLGTKILSVN